MFSKFFAPGKSHAVDPASQVTRCWSQEVHPTHPASQSLNLILWLAAALIIGLVYLAVSLWGYGVTGFPLDDAWIHQTYARNLASSGQLAFVPGVPSAGSTAPLWSFLLGAGYLLGAPFQLWTYGLGLILLGLTGWTVARLGTHLFPESRRIGLAAGLFCLFEWHHVWAALSGMETILFIWLSSLIFERYFAYQEAPLPSRQPQTAALLRCLQLGFLGGLLILTRPEGLGLVGLLALDMAFRYWQQSSGHHRASAAIWRSWLGLTVGLAVLLVPYVGFHLWATGLPFPNTFYAKQAEYGILLQSVPLWWRLFGNFGQTQESVQGVFRVIFIGPQLLLLPGLIYAAWLTIKERRLELAPVWLWWTGYLVLYALRLPVTYQHGRYQTPAIVWVILLGVWGTGRLWALDGKQTTRRPFSRVIGRVIVLSLIILVLSFTVLGAQAYGRDVRFIETEMVATAKWLNRHTEPDILIAVHDIGAIGYFTQRPLIDLAGLVTPEIIPIIRDETALFDFMLKQEVGYVVTFPSWYPKLTQHSQLTQIYVTDSAWAPQIGGENMAVYRVKSSD